MSSRLGIRREKTEKSCLATQMATLSFGILIILGNSWIAGLNSRGHIQYGVDGCQRHGLHLQFSRYEGQDGCHDLKRDNLDTDSLFEEAQDLFDSWWSTTHSTGEWNEEIKRQTWNSIWKEFGSSGLLIATPQ